MAKTMLRKISTPLAIFVIFLHVAFCDELETEPIDEDIEEDDPIVEDLTKVDLSQLKIVSREIEPSQVLGFECEHLKDEVLIYSYEALTASGKRVEMHLGDRKLIPAKKTIYNITNAYYPGEVHYIPVVPYLECLDMDHTILVDEVKGRIDPPSEEEYNFENLEKNFHGETGHPDDVDRIIFGGQLKDGFFIEAGSVDAETFSDTLYFEINHNWTGLLVEAIPQLYQKGLTKHRKAYGIQTCLSIDTKPKTEEFDQTAVWVEDEETKSMGGIVNDGREGTQQMQCMPLYTILLALGNPTVNWISLDIEGAEFAVLKTIPWDKVDIESLTVETHMLGTVFPGDRQEFLEYMESVGYRHIKDAHMGTNKLRQELGTIDDLFVRKDVPLAEERRKLTKDEL